MTWRSPFQTSKGGGVPFPSSLTPWASSPAQPVDAGSPMQISPLPDARSLTGPSGRATGLKRFSTLGKASPMDAAPYTPLSTLKKASTPPGNTDKDSSFVGKLSFTPHVNRPSQHGPSSVSRSPKAGPSAQLAGSDDRAQPPQASMYTDDAEAAAVKAPATSQMRQHTVPSSSNAAGLFKQSVKSSSTFPLPFQTAFSRQSRQRARNAAQPSDASQQRFQHGPPSPQASISTARLHADSLAASHDQQLKSDTGATLALQEPSALDSPDSSSRNTLASTAIQDWSPGHNLSLPQPSFQLDQAQSPLWQIQPPSENQSGMSKASTAAQGQHAAFTQTEQKQLPHRQGSQSIARHAQPSQSAAKLRSSGLLWQPMQAAVASPDKQELGRRIFGGLPASSPQPKQKGSAAKSRQAPDQPTSTSTTSAGQAAAMSDTTAQLQAEATSSSSSSSSNSDPAQLMEQLQRQVTQAAASAGIPLQQSVDALPETEPKAEQGNRLQGAEQAAEAVQKLQRLQQAGADFAEELEASYRSDLAKHGDQQSTAQSTKLSLASRAARAVVPRPDAFVHSRGQAVHHLPSASSELPAARADQGCQRDIADMLTRLKLLQQEGLKLAVAA